MGEGRLPLHIKISYHFKKRMVQRVHKLKLNSHYLEEHITYHNLELLTEAQEIVAASTFLWQGMLSNRYPQANFFLYQKEEEWFVIVIDSTMTLAITIYPVEFDLPGRTGRAFRRLLVSSIFRLRKARERSGIRKKPFFEKRRGQIRGCENQIREFEEKIAAERQKIAKYQGEVQREADALTTQFYEIGKLVKLLCAITPFEEDMEQFKKTGGK